MKLIAAVLALLASPVAAQTLPPGVWTPDRGDGTYANPVLQGDYSDPDAVRVGDDFYLVSSSFVNVPGLPILHSKDLVNWQLIGHALPRLTPDAHYTAPRHGGGVWAPAIRFHDGLFYIYYPDPDFGIYVVIAKDPAGPWSAPVLVSSEKGAIDPCPFWDDDGKAYLVHGWARSRAGFANIISLYDMAPDGMKVTGLRQDIITGDTLPKAKTSQGLKPWFTTEGPKLYKRDGWYYVFVPSDGVKGGFQGVLRARSIAGPYEGRDVLDQGATEVNGPHQGAWVTAPDGKDWFLHFQDVDSYGRRVWLEPMVWENGWPIIGQRQGKAAYGQPVLTFKKPVAGQAVSGPPVDDDFAHGYHLGWQWSANPNADWADTAEAGVLRLKAVSSPANLYEAGNILSQKLPGETFTATVRLSLHPQSIGERAGLTFVGYNYGFVGLENTTDGVRIVQATRIAADKAAPETVVAGPAASGEVYLRLHVEPVTVPDKGTGLADEWPSMLRSKHARVTFSYSLDGTTFVPMGEVMPSQPGRWVGAQVGLFAQAPSGTPSFVSTRIGWADFKTFKVTP